MQNIFKVLMEIGWQILFLNEEQDFFFLNYFQKHLRSLRSTELISLNGNVEPGPDLIQPLSDACIMSYKVNH